jgi:hypothetical protein
MFFIVREIRPPFYRSNTGCSAKVAGAAFLIRAI